jgi:restriction system protein
MMNRGMNMPRYWVIAPVESKNPQLFNDVWQFDVAQNLISIGWSELGDISKMSREDLSQAIAKTYSDTPNSARGLIRNMLWSFYHEIGVDDVIMARRGRKILAAVGKVTETAFYSVGKNPALIPPGYTHGNFLGVEWSAQPRNKSFETLVFPMQTLREITEEQYHALLSDEEKPADLSEDTDAITNQSVFALEKYLEEFIVSNFNSIFKGKLAIYEGAEGSGQQYPTDIGPIDILAREPASGSFLVIELKKGHPSDQVVGQVLRYMGWVKKNLCQQGQGVKGLIICRDTDLKLNYAPEMTTNIEVQFYSVSFTLSTAPKSVMAPM